MKFPFRAVAGMLLLIYSSLFAQGGQDKFGVKPEEWKSASLPVPYGFIGSFGYPLLGGPNKNAGIGDRIAFGVDAYYDAWLVGFHQTEHGTGFRISPRSIGREFYGGWYFEIGSRGYTQYSETYDQTLEKYFSDTNHVSATTYVIGYTAMLAPFLNTTSIAGGYSLALGYASGPNKDAYVIGEVEYDLGMRFPIGKNGLAFLLRIYAGGGFPDVDELVPVSSSEGKIHGFFGMKLSTQFGLNFEK